ncbi:MAG: ABA4-like family protein [Fulvivirga sp.]|uniref:ABA4-like family protein n=1 Tax=Fulvivirga sp. TaxID=1931237 RepID=UPI0032EAB44B
MDSSTVFNIVNAWVLPFWILLIFFPKWKLTNKIVQVGAALLAIIYSFYLITGPAIDFTSFGSLAGVKELFTLENAVLIGWVHYLAFDLLVGNWIVNEAKEIGINHWFIIPCLLFCFMLGPVGFLLFQLLKFAKVGRVN